jgi:multidrug resistance efflux pump
VHHDAAPLQDGRVKNIYVHIGSHVTNGQVVAQMDTTMVDTQVAEAEAMLANAEGTMAAYQGQMLSLVRTVEDEISKSKHALVMEKSQQESDLAKLGQLKSIQAERDKLAKSNLIPEPLADALRPEIAALEKQTAAYPEQIAMDQRVLEEQRKHRADLQKTLRLGPQDDIMKSIAEKTAAETRILGAVVELRKLEKETYSLRSETDGVVTDIGVTPGVVAKTGQSVVSIVSKSELIIGYLPEFRLGRLKTGDQGYAFRIGHPPVPVKVVEIVPEVDPIPVQLSPISAPLGATFRSQKIVFGTEQPSDITAGEKVEIRMESEKWAKAKRWLMSLRQ